jgi:hypothetical protein
MNTKIKEKKSKKQEIIEEVSSEDSEQLNTEQFNDLPVKINNYNMSMNFRQKLFKDGEINEDFELESRKIEFKEYD